MPPISQSKMFPNATVSSRSSSSRSDSCGRNSSMPSLRMQSPLSPRTSINPLFRSSDNQFTSFDASHFNYQQQKMADRRKSYLRRYNSHDSQGNFGGSSAESKDNTPDSTHDRISTKYDNSKGESASGSSPESTGDRKRNEFEVKDFLERYSLPRVVRVSGGEPLLLYRCFDSFTKVQARALSGKKGKEKLEMQVLQFPEGYPGWFSLVSEKGERCAVLHNTFLQLVREQVCSFLSLTSFTAYTAHPPDPTDGLSRMQYLKTVVRGGQVFRLRAVFQHRDKTDAGHQSTKSSRLSARSARNRDLANRYAQLIDVNNQELYAPLTTKGEFYEVYSSTKAKLCFPGMLDKTGPLALDKDCLYRLAHLLRRVHLPLKVRLMAGPLPTGLPKDFPDTFILERKFQEPLLVTCTLPPPNDTVKHEISCLRLNSKLLLSRSMLGFDTEYKLFKSQRLQSALSHCHKNVEQWYRQVRLVPNIKIEPIEVPRLEEEVCPGCRKLKKVCGQRCESKFNDDEEVRRYTETSMGKQLITKEVLEKFPKSKKWYRHFKILGSANETAATERYDLKEPIEVNEKVRSIDRYKDMSKLIEEKFGKKNYNPVKKSASFMFSTKRIDLEETPVQTKGDPNLLKCQSLDTQLHLQENCARKPRGSDVSETFSHEFRMCILDNESGAIDKPRRFSSVKPQSLRDLRSLNMTITEIDLNEIQDASIVSKPDLIPLSPEGSFDRSSNSIITDRLCSEFHVKTKIQKRNPKRIGDATDTEKTKVPSENMHVVQVHSISKVQNRALPVVDDLPYSQVVDQLKQTSTVRTSESENIYAEICDSQCRQCNREKCICKVTERKPDTQYCYVTLGSNGDSITQSSDDDLEAIYNTLR